MTSRMSTTTQLPCPKCALPMRVIERSSVGARSGAAGRQPLGRARSRSCAWFTNASL